jgi:hypothetical protein
VSARGWRRGALRAIIFIVKAARTLLADDEGPLHTFDDAPLLDEPDSEERRAAFDAAVEDYRTGRVRIHGGEEVHAELLEELRPAAE